MKSDHSVLAVIPARYGSVRLPGKPLIDLLGKTMIQRVYEQVNKARLVGAVIVATDDERIVKSITDVGGSAVLTDPELPSGSDRVAAVISEIDADIVVNVQGDEPLITPALIDETIEGLFEYPDAGVATPACIITDVNDISNPNCVKVVTDKHGRALYFSRSPIPYLRSVAESEQWISAYPFLKHFGLYVYRRATIQQFVELGKSTLEEAEQLEQLRLIEHGVRIQIVKTNYESYPVDSADDVERVREMLRK